MPSAVRQAFGIYELIEQIILQLNNPVEIIRAQRVCRNWRDIVQASPALQEACWYQPSNTKNAETRSDSGQQTWQLNPAFKCIGVSLPTTDTEAQGDFSLEKRIYDMPGSWTTMLATQPPCQRIAVACYSDYSDDRMMQYLIISLQEPLLMGDVMAVLAECQNRQKCGVDRWAGVRHYTGQLYRYHESDWEDEFSSQKMPKDVSINVVVEQAWGSGDYPAFSLRRIYGSKRFLHEMILHEMIDDWGNRYQWDWWNHGGLKERQNRVLDYQANLVVVKEHQEEGYLAECRDIFRLLSDIQME
ncbi:hypothetical protein FE257_000577 [Aspergillus nanangensis]|uniref:F-box domain-containing protein n=1 Tax=Aspergillus nanangensis TaxID=2582783 RepID=A0AAD4CF88_ASPNN|nr:hypothetical protein FE257_000577 [Aspergillus nanangensis]